MLYEIQIFFIILLLLIVPSVVLAHEVNITAGEQSYIVNTTGNYTSIIGEVLNITYIPAFDVDLSPLVKCNFRPFESHTLEGSKYEMLCEFAYNITKEQIYIPIPASLMKEFEKIKSKEFETEQFKLEYWFYRIATYALLPLLVVYFAYNEWWIYREE